MHLHYKKKMMIIIILKIRFSRLVHPLIQVPNQLVGAPVGSDVTLHCNVEASPKAINYWTRESGKSSLLFLSFFIRSTIPGSSDGWFGQWMDRQIQKTKKNRDSARDSRDPEKVFNPGNFQDPERIFKSDSRDPIFFRYFLMPGKIPGILRKFSILGFPKSRKNFQSRESLRSRKSF